LLAVAVIVWLPASLEQDPRSSEPAVTESAATAKPDKGDTSEATPAPTRSDAAPWSDAQAARQRRAAQETAAALLDLQYSLEERGVEQWASEAFTGAKDQAATGDTLYRDGQYRAANEQYEAALAAMQELEQSIPGELEHLLGLAREAIEAGDAPAAKTALSIAAVMSPGNTDIAGLKARTEKLADLLPLLEQAAAAEAAGDLASARQSLEQAATLDPEHKGAQAELERVTTAARAWEFNAAMSEGYAALDEGRYDSARTAFRKAASLQEGSSEAASALQEVAAAETAGRLSSLEQQGRAYERKEQWQQAVATYERAQKVDGSVLFAQDGLARSRPRAALDSQFQKVINEPQRLSDIAVAAAAEELLSRAAQVTPSGPRLQSQVRQLEALLEQYNSPVTVTLRSDSETEVIVYKVARLGRFAQRELTLRPGTYTAVGTRDGYRDVRRKFTLAHDGAPAPVTIICTEPI
jgi:tetratricopeptide (TPR) repeat protein